MYFGKCKHQGNLQVCKLIIIYLLCFLYTWEGKEQEKKEKLTPYVGNTYSTG